MMDKNDEETTLAQEFQKRKKAARRDGAPSGLTQLENAGLYEQSRKERKKQKEAFDPFQEYKRASGGAKVSVDGNQLHYNTTRGEYQKSKPDTTQPRTSWDSHSPLGRTGLKGGGKLAGKGLTKMAEKGGAVGSLFIYGLAIPNDFPDIADWMLEALLTLAAGIGPMVDFLFDAVVFLGFRYFLREHMNVSGVRALLYGATALELIPGPLDVFPFWTLCAWLALRAISEEQENKQRLLAGGKSEAAAKRKAGNLRRNRIQGAMEI